MKDQYPDERFEKITQPLLLAETLQEDFDKLLKGYGIMQISGDGAPYGHFFFSFSTAHELRYIISKLKERAGVLDKEDATSYESLCARLRDLGVNGSDMKFISNLFDQTTNGTERKMQESYYRGFEEAKRKILQNVEGLKIR